MILQAIAEGNFSTPERTSSDDRARDVVARSNLRGGGRGHPFDNRYLSIACT